VPFGLGVLVQSLDVDDPRGIDQGLQAAEPGRGLLDALPDLLFVGHIALDEHRLAAGHADCVLQPAAGYGLQVDDGDPRPLGREEAHRPLTDPRSAAADPGGASLQAQAHGETPVSLVHFCWKSGWSNTSGLTTPGGHRPWLRAINPRLTVRPMSRNSSSVQAMPL